MRAAVAQNASPRKTLAMPARFYLRLIMIRLALLRWRQDFSLVKWE